VSLRASRPRAAIIRATKYIIAALHLAEAKVFANGVALRKIAILLAPYIKIERFVRLRSF